MYFLLPFHAIEKFLPSIHFWPSIQIDSGDETQDDFMLILSISYFRPSLPSIVLHFLQESGLRAGNFVCSHVLLLHMALTPHCELTV